MSDTPLAVTEPTRARGGVRTAASADPVSPVSPASPTWARRRDHYVDISHVRRALHISTCQHLRLDRSHTPYHGLATCGQADRSASYMPLG